MKKMLRTLIVVSFLSTILVFNSSVFAGEGIPLGEDKRLRPYGEVKLQYDDNIFLSSGNEESDFIVTLTPGTELEWGLNENALLTFDYHADISTFMDNSTQDGTNHYLSGILDLDFNDFSVSVYDKFARVFERPSTEDTDRVKRQDNRIGVRTKFQKERFGIELGYENFNRDYEDAAYNPFDRTEHIYSAMLTHQTFEKTKLLLEYDYTDIVYDSDTRSDAKYYQFLVGAIGELTPKTEATIKTGMQWGDYQQGDDPDFDEWVVYADLIHKFSEKNSVKLSGRRLAQESTYATNNYYLMENVSATFNHFFTPKLLGFVTGLAQINSYPSETTEGTETKKREDDYSSLGAGLKYYMKEWFSVTLKADHIVRDSNFGIFDYDQNLVTLTARAEF